MADKKISQLTALTGANTAADDVLAIVDTNAAETKKITREEFFKNIQTNVGIGTSSPATLLNVFKSPQAGSNECVRVGPSPGSGSLSLSVYPSTSQSYGLIGSNTIYSSGGIARLDTNFGGSAIGLNKDNIVFWSGPDNANPTERARIDSSGNLGIGTSSPGQKLHISGVSGDILGARFGVTASSQYLDIYRDGTSGFSVYNAGQAAPFRAHIWQLGGSEAMRIDSSGNVGIGTSSPAARLDVVGSKDATNLIIGAALSTVGGAAFSNYSELLFKNTAGSNSDASIRSYGNVWNAAGSNLAFFTSNNSAVTERMRIDSSGNLGLGVTPSAWGSGFKAFQFGSRAAIYSSVAEVTSLANNLYFDGTNNKLIAAAAGARYYQNANSHVWDLISSGSANATAVITQAMTLDANRNLLLNGTSAGASAVGTLAIFNGTAPTGSVTNGVILYAEDVSASSELKVRDEAGNVTTLSPHNFSMIPEGASEDMAWAYYSERNGKKINVDMLKLARMVEKLTGEKLVYTD